MKPEFRVIDLSHSLSPDIPTWGGSCGFALEVKKDYDKVFRVHQIKMHAGAGTHMDAPSHRYEGGLSIADLSVEHFVAKGCIIDVRHQAHADYEISLKDIAAYEKDHGIIPQGSLVIGHTGWHRFWKEPSAYRNVDAKGQMHFPAFSADAAKLLLSRGIVGLGIDTISPDCLDHNYPVHKLLLGDGKYILENIADCSEMPPSGAWIIALPLKAAEATEAPTRVIGLIPI